MRDGHVLSQEQDRTLALLLVADAIEALASAVDHGSELTAIAKAIDDSHNG